MAGTKLQLNINKSHYNGAGAHRAALTDNTGMPSLIVYVIVLRTVKMHLLLLVCYSYCVRPPRLLTQIACFCFS